MICKDTLGCGSQNVRLGISGLGNCQVWLLSCLTFGIVAITQYCLLLRASGQRCSVVVVIVIVICKGHVYIGVLILMKTFINKPDTLANLRRQGVRFLVGRSRKKEE